ncbi:hypothetical protein [Streptobacillus moniliformis]|uniref:hypothetical protein n=1 Tax=Streptobacillus moniliformis TaxID=34105 RepID=UPI0007E41447|nr:hypothetical protein [Streptobacillus moniliformis]
MIESILKGIASIIAPRYEKSNILKKYPMTFSRNDKEVLMQDWIKIGNDFRIIFNELEKEINKK